MKLTLARVLLYTLFYYPAAASPASDNADIASRSTSDFCAPIRQAVPFLRAYQPNFIDYFYTTNAFEYNTAIAKSGYRDEQRVGSIFPYSKPLTSPLYRFNNPTVHDHYYTTLLTEKADAVVKLGYKREGIAGYVYTDPDCGTVPLYRYYNREATSHFYTLSEDEGNNATMHHGYHFETVAGYVFNM